MKLLALSGGKDSMACLHLLRDELAGAIYVDTGYAYPETQQMIEYAQTLIPVHIVRSDRYGQNQAQGIPADVVPMEWTATGQAMTSPKPVLIQSGLQCCLENLGQPLFAAAKRLGATHIVYGQRADESHRAPVSDGTVHDGITRLHPIEHWTAQQVLDYLATKMEVPAHYRLAHSSLDCYDCSAYLRQTHDLWRWTAEQHPDFYAARLARRTHIDHALKEALLC